MQLFIGIAIGIVIGAVLMWIYKSRIQAVLQKENDALKASATKAASKL